MQTSNKQIRIPSDYDDNEDSPLSLKRPFSPSPDLDRPISAKSKRLKKGQESPGASLRGAKDLPTEPPEDDDEPLLRPNKKKKKKKQEAPLPLQRISPNQEGVHVPWAPGEDAVSGGRRTIFLLAVVCGLKFQVLGFEV